MKVLIDEEEWYPVLTVSNDYKEISYWENKPIASIVVVDVPQELFAEYQIALQCWNKIQNKLKKIIEEKNETSNLRI